MPNTTAMGDPRSGLIRINDAALTPVGYEEIKMMRIRTPPAILTAAALGASLAAVTPAPAAQPLPVCPPVLPPANAPGLSLKAPNWLAGDVAGSSEAALFRPA